jgi:prepilin-type N-terminal cleavage/methylation domain-containing protein
MFSRAHHNQKGFFLIEVIVSVAIIGVVIIYVLGSIYDTVEVAALSLERTQAAFLLEENAEVLKIKRASLNGWTAIQSVTGGATYGLSWNGSDWDLVSGAQTIGMFSRGFVCTDASRDAQDDIVSSGGTVDTDTKVCTVSVSWQGGGAARVESLSFYITNTTLW